MVNSFGFGTLKGTDYSTIITKWSGSRSLMKSGTIKRQRDPRKEKMRQPRRHTRLREAWPVKASAHVCGGTVLNKDHGRNISAGIAGIKSCILFCFVYLA